MCKIYNFNPQEVALKNTILEIEDPFIVNRLCKIDYSLSGRENPPYRLVQLTKPNAKKTRIALIVGKAKESYHNLDGLNRFVGLGRKFFKNHVKLILEPILSKAEKFKIPTVEELFRKIPRIEYIWFKQL